MAKNHTPGPWGCVDRDRVIFANPEFGLMHVAKTALDFGREAAFANARLISAAPDLLVACQAVLPALEWCHAQGLQTSGALEIVRAAIAKARG